jgi:hypothetical protein
MFLAIARALQVYVGMENRSWEYALHVCLDYSYLFKSCFSKFLSSFLLYQLVNRVERSKPPLSCCPGLTTFPWSTV